MPPRLIQVGVFGRAHGVRGLVRVTSYTADPAALASYGPLTDGRGRWFTLRWAGEGVAEVAEIVGGVPVKVADRAAAGKLTNVRLFVDRAALPAPQEDEFYLADLIGLAAADPQGTPLGTVSAVHDYGAGASLEIERPGAPPVIVPFTRLAVPGVDVAGGRVTVAMPEEIVAPERPGAPEDAAA